MKRIAGDISGLQRLRCPLSPRRGDLLHHCRVNRDHMGYEMLVSLFAAIPSNGAADFFRSLRKRPS